MGQRRARGQRAAVGEGAAQAIDDRDAERCTPGIQDGELASRIAGQDAQPIEQSAERAVHRIKQIVRGVERCRGGIDDPGLELGRLEHAVAGQEGLGVVEPEDDADQQHEGAYGD
jgi:hypothetical protein